MITPELKELSSYRLKCPALPLDPKDCLVSMEAVIGPKGELGEELFFFTVATPRGLLREPLPRWGRGLLIIEEFSWPSVEHSLLRLLTHAQRNSWAEVTAALRQELDWEFENYQP